MSLPPRKLDIRRSGRKFIRQRISESEKYQGESTDETVEAQVCGACDLSDCEAR
jgi:hypothetical protein